MTNPIIDYKGTKRWYNDKLKLHRENGPAVEHTDGTKIWYKNGLHHREDGPAVEYGPNAKIGATLKFWWINGKIIK
jgi:hypothetical protein